MKISKKDLEAKDLPSAAIHDEIVDQSRWSLIHEIVFKWTDGKYYMTNYSVGATESQDEQPWEYEDEVECTEVEEKEITIKKWVAKQVA